MNSFPFVSIFLLCLALTACTVTKTQLDADEPITKGNIIPNSSFESFDVAGHPIGWQGTGCTVNGGQKISGNTSLNLIANPEQYVTCISEKFPVTPGHFRFTAWFKGEGLMLSRQRTLSSALEIRLRVFDSEGRVLPQPVKYKEKSIDGELVNYAFAHIDDDAIVKNSGYSLIHLVSRPYPYDTGWIPEGAVSAEIEFILHGPGNVFFDELKLERSVWNVPLIERVKKFKDFIVAEQAVSLPPHSQRMVNSQGPASVQLSQLSPALKNLQSSGVNAMCFELRPANIAQDAPSPDILNVLSVATRTKHPHLSFGVSYNPYWKNEGENQSGSVLFSDPNLSSRIMDFFRPFLKAGSKFVLLRADDLAPATKENSFAYRLDLEADIRKFKTLGYAHAHLIKELRRSIDREFPGVALYFVPPWYNLFFVEKSKGLAKKYFSELVQEIPASVEIMWTGPTVRSLFIDSMHVERFKNLLGGKTPILWDNTLYGRRHKDLWLESKERIELNSLLEPYAVEMPLDYANGSTMRDPVFFINGGLSSLEVIQNITAAQFFSEPDTYVAEKVLMSYLFKRFGESLSWKILEFDRQLWKVKRAKLENNYEDIEQAVERLIDVFDELQETLPVEENAFLKDLQRSVEGETTRTLGISVPLDAE